MKIKSLRKFYESVIVLTGEALSLYASSFCAAISARLEDVTCR